MDRDFRDYQLQFIDEAMRLIKAELESGNSAAATVLFGDELGAANWTPEDAVSTLFRYASLHGWDEESF